jgi:hypothetical protein
MLIQRLKIKLLANVNTKVMKCVGDTEYAEGHEKICNTSRAWRGTRPPVKLSILNIWVSKIYNLNNNIVFSKATY